jgi:hypothetical protein
MKVGCFRFLTISVGRGQVKGQVKGYTLSGVHLLLFVGESLIELPRLSLLGGNDTSPALKGLVERERNQSNHKEGLGLRRM